MAMGGSMTATTQAVARYTPSNRKPPSHHGSPAASPRLFNQGCTVSRSSAASIPDGTLAPSIVIQKTAARIASISGNPSQRLVRSRSRVRSKSKPARFSPRICVPSAICWAAA